ncbi:Glutathione S-transferase, C-terminal [Dillenia turbinata]|uniref:glutathione transferase n=1 Tax=Dillenia turbinata TaxID=194707 RepID=A0AAN8W0Q6_9MAGN
MATPVKVNGPPASTAVSRVLACLLEKEVQFQLINVGMSKREHKSPEYLKLAFAPKFKVKQDEEVIKQNEEKLSKVVDVYEKRPEEYRFLAGEEFTLADLSHLPNTQYLVSTDRARGLFSEKKNVWRWWGEISGRESWKKVVDMQNAPPA